MVKVSGDVKSKLITDIAEAIRLFAGRNKKFKQHLKNLDHIFITSRPIASDDTPVLMDGDVVNAGVYVFKKDEGKYSGAVIASTYPYLGIKVDTQDDYDVVITTLVFTNILHEIGHHVRSCHKHCKVSVSELSYREHVREELEAYKIAKQIVKGALDKRERECILVNINVSARGVISELNSRIKVYEDILKQS